jgi:DNA-binding transcriptional MocR family regulator
MPADPLRRTIKLGPAAHELRRHVGPTTWVVLEEMLQRSTGDDGHVVAQVSIRSLASSLGLAKDTVTRAVGRLRDLGVIDASQGRSRSGVFEAGSYRLAVPAVCLSPAGPQLAGPSQPSALSPAPRPCCAAPPSAPRSSSAARPSPPARRSSGQLSLLPEL